MVFDCSAGWKFSFCITENFQNWVGVEVFTNNRETDSKNGPGKSSKFTRDSLDCFIVSSADRLIHGPVHGYLLTFQKPIKSKLIECYYQCDNIQCSIREPFIGQIQGSTDLNRTIWEKAVPRSSVRLIFERKPKLWKAFICNWWGKKP